MMKCNMYKILANPPEILGGGYSLTYRPSIKDMRSFLMITILGYHLHKNADGVD